eukprot:365068-Chlamydomonas_euryale.AAC.5
MMTGSPQLLKPSCFLPLKERRPSFCLNAQCHVTYTCASTRCTPPPSKHVEAHEKSISNPDWLSPSIELVMPVRYCSRLCRHKFGTASGCRILNCLFGGTRCLPKGCSPCKASKPFVRAGRQSTGQLHLARALRLSGANAAGRQHGRGAQFTTLKRPRT